MLHVAILGFLWHPLGSCATSPHSAFTACRSYNFWSGIAGSFVVGGGIWVGAFTMIRRHNCHSKRCLRIGSHPVEGTPYVVCKKHHPSVPDGGASTEHIHDSHREALKGAVKVREG